MEPILPGKIDYRLEASASPKLSATQLKWFKDRDARNAGRSLSSERSARVVFTYNGKDLPDCSIRIQSLKTYDTFEAASKKSLLDRAYKWLTNHDRWVPFEIKDATGKPVYIKINYNSLHERLFQDESVRNVAVRLVKNQMESERAIDERDWSDLTAAMNTTVDGPNIKKIQDTMAHRLNVMALRDKIDQVQAFMRKGISFDNDDHSSLAPAMDNFIAKRDEHLESMKNFLEEFNESNKGKSSEEIERMRKEIEQTIDRLNAVPENIIANLEVILQRHIIENYNASLDRSNMDFIKQRIDAIDVIKKKYNVVRPAFDQKYINYASYYILLKKMEDFCIREKHPTEFINYISMFNILKIAINKLGEKPVPDLKRGHKLKEYGLLYSWMRTGYISEETVERAKERIESWENRKLFTEPTLLQSIEDLKELILKLKKEPWVDEPIGITKELNFEFASTMIDRFVGVATKYLDKLSLPQPELIQPLSQAIQDIQTEYRDQLTDTQRSQFEILSKRIEKLNIAWNNLQKPAVNPDAAPPA